ncbi:XRE family transcriptional regulator [Salinarimonas sp.]|uniref:helix-turn-helix domain-containing protein n=1 Tax=Salinarimonas sp. TaxID=2766526 RepID=UPI0032D92F70
MEPTPTSLPARLRAARIARRWTLDQLADAAGVGRATISKIERGDASPTAAILARIAAGLEVSVASLFSENAAPAPAAASPLARAADQATWTDPESGYVRRNVSPPGAAGAAEIVDVTFPPGRRVLLDNPFGWHGLAQQVWALEGAIEITVGEVTTRLAAGDCLFLRLDRPVAFHNPGETPARYAVVLSRLTA